MSDAIKMTVSTIIIPLVFTVILLHQTLSQKRYNRIERASESLYSYTQDLLIINTCKKNLTFMLSNFFKFLVRTLQAVFEK